MKTFVYYEFNLTFSAPHMSCLYSPRFVFPLNVSLKHLIKEMGTDLLHSDQYKLLKNSLCAAKMVIFVIVKIYFIIASLSLTESGCHKRS